MILLSVIAFHISCCDRIVTMKLRKLRSDIDLTGKRVLIRVDVNVPIKNGKTVDGPHGRIARVAVDIDWLSQRGAKVIVLAHLGRPNGKRVSAYSIRPVAKRLSGLLKTKVLLSHSIVGPQTKSLVEKMKNGDVLLLENLRFDPREEQNAPSFAHALAEFGDYYINDAFSVSHREHASVDAITSDIQSFAGPLLSNEVSILSKLDKNVKQPFVLIIGGLKIETKLPIIERFLPHVSAVLIGGAIGTTFLVADGYSVGRSVFDKDEVKIAKGLLAKHRSKLIIPTDVVVARSLRKDAQMNVADVTNIQQQDRIIDIGSKTINIFTEIIKDARTIVWNGPIGYCEIEKFCEGTRAIAKAIAKRTGDAMTIVGGGDTVPVLEELHLADKFTLLSTGGGALLEYLSGKKLPGLEVLKEE